MSCAEVKTYACAIQAAWTEESSAEQAVKAVAAGLDRARIGQLIVFFSPLYPVAALCDALGVHFPDIPIAGCSTAGQIVPSGFSERGMLVLGFPKDGFRVSSDVLTDIHDFSLERGVQVVRQLRAKLDHSAKPLRGDNFALFFIDGLSKCEELIVSVLGWALDDIPLIGGSAGDNLVLSGTTLLHNGKIYQNAALLLLVETDYVVRTFKHDNFEPTDKKLVVTASNSETRTVYELNAECAANEYACAIGVDHKGLSPMSFAASPVVVRIGGEYFCRSIQKVNPGGSLSFFCAIDDGVVLTVAKARDLVQSAEKMLDEIDREIGGLDLIIGFECVLRRLDAEIHQCTNALSRLYRERNVVGFHTYGEQFNSMHVNQTLTGVAIGPKACSYSN